MRSLFLISGLIFFFLTSCSNKDEVPKDILQPEKMKSVLWDMVRVQNLSKEVTINDSLINNSVETKILTERVFQIYKIDSAIFENSYNWYLKHPVLMKRLMDSLFIQKQREGSKPEREDSTSSEKNQIQAGE